MALPRMTAPMINQDRRTIDVFSQAYDDYCTPYVQSEFSDEIRRMAARRSVKLQPCKAIFIGDVSVGKTTIVNRFCYNKFQNTYKATIGVDFEVESFKILGQTFSLQIWDTAGQERFKCIAQAYYRNANIIVIVFDMTKEETLRASTTWLESALTVNSIQKPLIFLVGSKSDLPTNEDFLAMEKLAYDVARGMCAEYWSVSARTGFNIVELFQRIASLAFESMMKQNLIEETFGMKLNQPEKGGFLHGLASGFDCNANKDPTKKGRCLC